MITKISGVLSRVLDEEVRLQVGPMEYQVLVPEFVRRQVQGRIGRELTLHTCHYFDGNPMQGRVVPRLVGFLSEPELDFFDLFCTVDKVGTKKALKAMVRPVKEIADAIQRTDTKWLTTLPGIGAATAVGRYCSNTSTIPSYRLRMRWARSVVARPSALRTMPASSTRGPRARASSTP